MMTRSNIEFTRQTETNEEERYVHAAKLPSHLTRLATKPSQDHSKLNSNNKNQRHEQEMFNADNEEESD